MDVLTALGSEVSRRRLAQTLPSPGVGLVEAGQADVASDVLTAAVAPALALIDWDPAVCDGPELCRLVRACRAACRPYIILLAGSGHHLAEGLDAGVDDCVRLPADADELRARLDVGRRFAALPWERVTEEGCTDVGSQPDPDALPAPELDAQRLPDDAGLGGDDRDRSRGRFVLTSMLGAK